jgi:hypothetical protein
MFKYIFMLTCLQLCLFMHTKQAGSLTINQNPPTCVPPHLFHINETHFTVIFAFGKFHVETWIRRGYLFMSITYLILLVTSPVINVRNVDNRL